MKNVCFWSTVVLVAVVLCLESVQGRSPMYKKYEAGSRRIHGVYCGDRIMDAYYSICYSGKRKRSASMNEKEASNFLHSQTKRSKRGTSTDIVEECCTEGCHYEEIYEYC